MAHNSYLVCQMFYLFVNIMFLLFITRELKCNCIKNLIKIHVSTQLKITSWSTHWLCNSITVLIPTVFLITQKNTPERTVYHIIMNIKVPQFCVFIFKKKVRFMNKAWNNYNTTIKIANIFTNTVLLIQLLLNLLCSVNPVFLLII